MHGSMTRMFFLDAGRCKKEEVRPVQARHHPPFDRQHKTTVYTCHYLQPIINENDYIIHTTLHQGPARLCL